MKKQSILLTFILLFSSLAFADSFDDIEKLMQEREKMFKSLMNGMFSDEPMDSTFFNGMSLNGSMNASSSFEMDWKDTSKGKRLEITPQDDKSPINIDINKDRISLSGKIINEESDAKGNIISKTSSSFSQSLNVPQNLDGDKAEIKKDGKKIVVDFPFKKSVQKAIEPQKRILKPIESHAKDTI